MPMPKALQTFIDGIEPRRVVKTALPVAGGMAAAALGGRLLRMVDAVEDFAAGGELQDAGVTLVGGIAVDAVVTAGIYVAASRKGGEKNAAKLAMDVGALMGVGTVVAAFAPVAAPYLADGVEAIADAVAGIFGLSAPATPVKLLPQSKAMPQFAKKPGGLADFNPGGLADFNPGGISDPYAVPGGIDPYAMSAFG